ncbi:MAG: hypothetical protein NZ898_04280 [Myxococcota bacterium]|nr:hypothetical protein [Myxococcota bacterium]
MTKAGGVDGGREEPSDGVSRGDEAACGLYGRVKGRTVRAPSI